MWSTAVKNGLKSAVLMWPGPPKMSMCCMTLESRTSASLMAMRVLSEDGAKPTYWKPFANKIQWDLKTDQIMKWLGELWQSTHLGV